MCFDGSQLAPRDCIPQLQCAFGAAAGDGLAVGAEGYAVYGDGVAAKRVYLLAGRRVPELDRLCPVACGDRLAVGTESDLDFAFVLRASRRERVKLAPATHVE